MDIGCGEGFFTKRFFSANCSHVDGVDIEPSAIRCAERENGAGNIKYHLLDAVNQDFPEREYNVIVWDGAIGHFPPDTLEIMLQKIAKSLSADGIFVGSESLGDEGSDHLTRFIHWMILEDCFRNTSSLWKSALENTNSMEVLPAMKHTGVVQTSRIGWKN